MYKHRSENIRYLYVCSDVSEQHSMFHIASSNAVIHTYLEIIETNSLLEFLIFGGVFFKISC